MMVCIITEQGQGDAYNVWLVLVIAQPECNMPYIALEQYNARGPGDWSYKS